MRKNYPHFYYKNVAQHKQRKFLEKKRQEELKEFYKSEAREDKANEGEAKA